MNQVTKTQTKNKNPKQVAEGKKLAVKQKVVVRRVYRSNATAVTVESALEINALYKGLGVVASGAFVYFIYVSLHKTLASPSIVTRDDLPSRGVNVEKN